MNFFRKKKKTEERILKEVDWSSANAELSTEEAHALFSSIFNEPQTNATIRLAEGAMDYGAKRGIRTYNAHKKNLSAWNCSATAIAERRFQSENQWVNVPQSVNAGFSNAQLSYYLFQVVNYYDCMIQAQDPLMSKVLSILSETPFSKGGYIENLKKEDAKNVLDAAERQNIIRKVVKAIRSMECVGGCLIYLQTDDNDLSEPLDLLTYDVRKVTDFIHIDPINVAATVVNTIEPAKADYMEPEIWYVIGLGNVHKSRFLKFEDNVPELLLRPMCMYFGTPLTNLIKQDIANSNLATQGLANLINRCRYMFLKTDDQSYTTANVKNFKDRLRVMSKMQDNFMFTPIKATEDVVQQTTALTGFSETTEFLYEVISAKTSIPMTELMGTSAKGLNATGEGDRRAWYDRVTALRTSVQNQFETMLGIIAGQDDGVFKEIHYRFNALETPTERETAEIRKATLEVAKAIIEVGGNQEQTFDWLKKLDFMGLDSVDFDAESFDNDPFIGGEPEGSEAFSQNAEDFEGNPFDNTGETETDFSSLNEWDESKHSRGKDGKFSKEGCSVDKEKEIESVIDKALNNPNNYEKVDIGEVSDKLKDEASKAGFDLSGYVHNIDVSGVRHAFLHHGDKKKEEKRGQIAITDDDIKKIPQIVKEYDTVDFGGTNSIGRDIIKYSKKFDDGTTFYVEEIRTGRKRLTIQTMYKNKS